MIEVRPRRPGAAPVSIGLMSDELWVRAGRTHFEIWISKRRPDPCAVLEELLEAVFAGRMEEAGRTDTFARIPLRNGRAMTMGSARLPIPWSWRRPLRYASYEAGRPAAPFCARGCLQPSASGSCRLTGTIGTQNGTYAAHPVKGFGICRPIAGAGCRPGDHGG